MFAGVIALEDPLREKAKEFIEKLKDLNIKIKLVTGDHKESALSVALRLGITKQMRALTGEEISKMSDKQLSVAIKSHDVFARVLPHQKLRIVKLLKKEGERVAMLGDGVNDAPALAYSDAGFAVETATETAKQAADFILVKKGIERVYEGIFFAKTATLNISKSVGYLLTGSFTITILILLTFLTKNPLPLLPVQILWYNVVTELFTSIPFAFERFEKIRQKNFVSGLLPKPLFKYYVILGVSSAFSAFLFVVLF